MCDLGVFAEFALTRLAGTFEPAVCSKFFFECLHFKRILITFTSGCFFKPVNSAYFLKSQEMRDLGVVAKSFRTVICGKFCSRRLQQNVLRCLHFMRILIRR